MAVHWYLRYGLSYRDVEELLAERDIEVDHVTVYRWVQRFTPLLIDAVRTRGRNATSGFIGCDSSTCRVRRHNTLAGRLRSVDGQQPFPIVLPDHQLAARADPQLGIDLMEMVFDGLD